MNELASREVVVAIGVLAVLALILVPAFIGPAKHKPRSAISQCVNNPKQVGHAFRIWANDSFDRYSMGVEAGDPTVREDAPSGRAFSVLQVLSNELPVPKTLVCPSDTRVAATNWASLANESRGYFVGLDAMDARPNLVLTGDRNLARDGKLLSGAVTLGTNAPLVWTRETHRKNGNIVLVDGSVQQVTTELLRQQLKNSGDATNLLVFPQ